MKKLLKYGLVNGTFPVYMSDGGYFYDNTTFVGVSADIDEDYTPANTVWMTVEELDARIAAWNAACEASSLTRPPGMPDMPFVPVTRSSFIASVEPFIAYEGQPTIKERIEAVEDIIAEITSA